MWFFVFSVCSKELIGQHPDVECIFNNTEKTADGMCVCLPGYVSDPFLVELGCWKCEDKCHPLAKCMYPGKCQCNEGFNGSGIICFSPIPLSFKKKSLTVLEEGGYNFEIEHTPPEGYTPANIFVQIGYEIFNSTNFTREYARFIVPPSISGHKNATISYDRINWANDVKVLYFEKTINNKFIAESAPFVFALVIIVIFGTCFLHGKQIVIEEIENHPNMMEKELDELE